MPPTAAPFALRLKPHQILMEAYDDGPGIKDIAQAMQPGFQQPPKKFEKKDLALEWAWQIFNGVWMI